ncbi:hypothetical protein DSO57_1008361 [Entomophthora muscae]|uniref:Uncharacterized protein n=1 Tax=Entomophthora muscae TaxID=34485 RepID=A0ACC2RYA5_9FUNG|nr:hypothetical protein DSO57_1008361 [Entomophthora muscae]
MEFTEGKIKKGEILMDFSESFYLETQTLVSMGASTFVDVKGALLNYIRPNRELSIALKSGIYGARTVPELMHHLGSFKEQFEVEENSLTASSNQPSPPIDPDPNIPDCTGCLLDQEACPERYFPDKEEINKDLLHRVLAVNTVTRKQAICTKSLPSKEAVDTVSIPYAEQLSMPYTEVTHKSASVKKLSQLLRLVQVSTNLDTLKSLKPELTTALESFLAQFKVRAILDSGAPGNIVSTRLVKKLKLEPDLDYNKEFETAGPDRKKTLETYLFLPLCFGKLVVTAPAIVLRNESYDILIRTSFMATYVTIINHWDSTFSILGHSVPMFYHGNRPRDLPTKKVHYSNMEYTDGDIPVAYTLRQRKIKVLSLAAKEYKGIPLYSSRKFSIPIGSQVIHNTGLSLSFPKGMHGEVSGLHNGSQLEPCILAGIIMPSLDEILVLLGNLSNKSLNVKKHHCWAT